MSSVLWIMNFSGNVGKTTTARHMFEPMLGADVVNIESQNDSDNSAEAIQIAAKFFTDLADRMTTLGYGDKPLIVDVGSSCVEAVMLKMGQIGGVLEDIHSIVIPVVPKDKQLSDTYRTVKALISIGMPAEKIFILLNEVTDPDTVKTDFAEAFAAKKKFGVTVLDQGVLSHEVYAYAKLMKMSIGELAQYPVTREMIAAEPDPEKRAELGPKLTRKRMAGVAQRNLRAVCDEFIQRSGFPVHESVAAA